MSESPMPMADTPYKNERLAEIAHMANLLTDRLLNDQIIGRPVSKTDIRTLLEASALLKDYGQAIPPLLSQIVHDVADVKASGSSKGQGEADLEDAERLAWSLRPFQEPKGHQD